MTRLADITTVIVGGGACGVNLGLRLGPSSSLVLEQGVLFQAWNKDRWDDFAFNTPLAWNGLYGQSPVEEGTSFRDQIRIWREYVDDDQKLNYQEGHTVTSVERLPPTTSTSYRFRVTVKDNQSTYSIDCINVVCCSGENAIPKLPAVAASVPSSILSIHSKHYKGPHQFHSTNTQQQSILVVGSGQSGCQIAQDLIRKGKRVTLATSAVAGCFFSLYGRHLFWWAQQIGFMDMSRDKLALLPDGDARRYAAKPVTGSGGPISIFSLHRQGALIVGGVDSIRDGNTLVLKPNRPANAEKALTGYNDFVANFVGWYDKQPEDVQATLCLDPDDTLPEPEWEPVPEIVDEIGPTELSLDDYQGIIWCTGYRSAVQSYLKIPEALETDFDDRSGSPCTATSFSVPGLYYSGFPWTPYGVSDILGGFERDQTNLIEHMTSTAVESS